MEIINFFENNLAGTYIFSENDADYILAQIEKKFSLEFGKSLNAIVYEAENFGIDDSRAISEISNLQNQDRTFIAIISRSLTHEAQNSLLKTLEEPKEKTSFLIFVDNPELLLPTLHSRSHVFKNIPKSNFENEIGNEKGNEIESKMKGESKKDSEKNKIPNFLEISLGERFDFIEKISKKIKKDDPNAFRDFAFVIFDSVISELGKNAQNVLQNSADVIEKILTLRSFLLDRGSSPKQLLETMSMQIEKLARK